MITVQANILSNTMKAALLGRGLTAEHSGFVVKGLVDASLRGIDTHGIRLFPTYLRELDGGRANVRPLLRWETAGSGGRRLDADGALGLVAGTVAAREAVRGSRHLGIAAVLVVNSNHFGAASTFTLEMAESGTVGICCSNADALVAPYGGVVPLLGTNPLSIAARGAGTEMFCLDMATSQISFSQVDLWLRRGSALPQHWGVRADGTDAAGCTRAHDMTALQPLGGYKGQGLGMAVTMLCALLGNMPLDHELSHLYTHPFTSARKVSHLFIAIDVGSFVQPDVFRNRLTEYLRYTRAQPAAEGHAVRVPGDVEAEAHNRRSKEGIPISSELLDELQDGGVALR